MERAVLEPSSRVFRKESLDGVEPSKARRPSIRSPKGTRPEGRGGEHEVGVKWKVQRRVSHARTLACLWAAPVVGWLPTPASPSAIDGVLTINLSRMT
jgi:hypothetical protein